MCRRQSKPQSDSKPTLVTHHQQSDSKPTLVSHHQQSDSKPTLVSHPEPTTDIDTEQHMHPPNISSEGPTLITASSNPPSMSLSADSRATMTSTKDPTPTQNEEEFIKNTHTLHTGTATSKVVTLD